MISPGDRVWLRTCDPPLGLAADRGEHLASYQSAPWAHDEPVRAEAGARILRAAHAGLRGELGVPTRAWRDGEVPARERETLRRSGAKILHADGGAQVAARRPEPPEQPDDELLRRTFGDDAEPAALGAADVRAARPAHAGEIGRA